MNIRLPGYNAMSLDGWVPRVLPLFRGIVMPSRFVSSSQRWTNELTSLLASTERGTAARLFRWWKNWSHFWNPKLHDHVHTSESLCEIWQHVGFLRWGVNRGWTVSPLAGRAGTFAADWDWLFDTFWTSVTMYGVKRGQNSLYNRPRRARGGVEV